MACGRVVILIFALSFTTIDSKVYNRCQLTRELLKNNFPRTFVKNWVCMIEQESGKNTAAFNEKSARSKFYGLFQIGSEWCKEGRKGGKCDISCEALLDEDIRDDSICALTIFEQKGFNYWLKWQTRCKGHVLPDIEKCADWQFPSSRASPPRTKRLIRARRSTISDYKSWLMKLEIGELQQI